MDTPLADFLRAYADRAPVRLHMPGHKGLPRLGCEPLDITEIPGADDLSHPAGIIARSQRNAAALFGSAATFYSVGGSSQCVRAMVCLAARDCPPGARPLFLAARNAHKSFLYALALCDADVLWLYGGEESGLCACALTAGEVEQALRLAPHTPAAVYVTSPDYLGNRLPLREIADVCHRYGTRLLVDNAHGAYLHFLPAPAHPLDLGADMCCDSAHKTLPVLTGGAYLHIGHAAPREWIDAAPEVLSLFGTTSPSYLILGSLDLCNRYLSDGYSEKLQEKIEQIEKTRELLRGRGWTLPTEEPLKITLRAPASQTGEALAARLRDAGIECEYADRDYLVLMLSADSDGQDLRRLSDALGENRDPNLRPLPPRPRPAAVCMTVRQAIFSPREVVPVRAAVGRVCAAPAVSCPPAVPIAVSGEVIDADTVALFDYYGVQTVPVVRCDRPVS